MFIKEQGFGEFFFLFRKTNFTLYKPHNFGIEFNFGKDCPLSPQLESIQLNGEEICFIPKREDIKVSKNHPRNCTSVEVPMKNISMFQKEFVVLTVQVPISISSVVLDMDVKEGHKVQLLEVKLFKITVCLLLFCIFRGVMI